MTETIQEAPVIEPGSLPLENSDHERFCRGIALHGLTYSKSYGKYVQTDGADEWIYAHASDLARRNRERIDFLRKTAAQTVAQEIKDTLGVTGVTLARYHLEVMETPVGELAETDELVQKVRKQRRVTAGGNPQEWEILSIEMPGKTESAKALADLIGANAPVKSQVESNSKVEVTSEDMLTPENLPGCHAFGVHLRNYPEAVREMLNGLEGRDFGDGAVSDLPA